MKENNYNPNLQNNNLLILPIEIQDIIECLAVKVHDQWAAKRIQEGWKYGFKRNDETKEHPSLIPFTQLSEEEKDYDRQTVIRTLIGLKENGFEIKKIE